MNNICYNINTQLKSNFVEIKLICSVDTINCIKSFLNKNVNS